MKLQADCHRKPVLLYVVTAPITANDWLRGQLAVMGEADYDAHLVARDSVIDEVTGVLVSPGDVQGLAAALARLRGDRAFRMRLGECGQRRVAPLFDQQTVWNAYLDLYRGAGRGIAA